jgi:hypothetical protein
MRDITNGILGKNTDQPACHAGHLALKGLFTLGQLRLSHPRSNGAGPVDDVQADIGKIAFNNEGERPPGVDPGLGSHFGNLAIKIISRDVTTDRVPAPRIDIRADQESRLTIGFFRRRLQLSFGIDHRDRDFAVKNRCLALQLLDRRHAEKMGPLDQIRKTNTTLMLLFADNFMHLAILNELAGCWIVLNCVPGGCDQQTGIDRNGKTK